MLGYLSALERFRHLLPLSLLLATHVTKRRRQRGSCLTLFCRCPQGVRLNVPHTSPCLASMCAAGHQALVAVRRLPLPLRHGGATLPAQPLRQVSTLPIVPTSAAAGAATLGSGDRPDGPPARLVGCCCTPFAIQPSDRRGRRADCRLNAPPAHPSGPCHPSLLLHAALCAGATSPPSSLRCPCSARWPRRRTKRSRAASPRAQTCWPADPSRSGPTAGSCLGCLGQQLVAAWAARTAMGRCQALLVRTCMIKSSRRGPAAGTAS